MILVRPAQEADIPQIRDIYLAVYGQDYPYQQFYDEQWLKWSIFSDDVLMLVAEETDGGRVVGTASVVFDIGAHSDLVGEFGRLAVHPDFRLQRIGSLLMEKRIEAIQDRLHVGLVEARVIHPYAQKISMAHGFSPMGFLPLKHSFTHRESLGLLGRYFHDALALRKNHPRIVPEAYPLAHLSMEQAGLPCDVIVDEDSAAYPATGEFQLTELTAKGYPSLLRIERGRVRNREIFGHTRLEYGFFKLRARQATYLLARDGNRIVGAIGFTLDRIEHTVRVIELITFTEQVIRFLLTELERKCREEWDVQYIETDVSAHAPRMQRTLIELQFVPAAYIPALVFHEVERLDIVRMVRLTALQDLGPVDLVPPMRAVADLVMQSFRDRTVAPRIAQAVADIPLFEGLNEEQRQRLAGTCSLKEFQLEERIFSEGEQADRMFILLRGSVRISLGTPTVKIGMVHEGETLGELSFLTSGPHSATANAESLAEAGELTHADLADLARRRPDIGLIIYRNLAAGLGQKLLRSDSSLRERLLSASELFHFSLPHPSRDQ